MKELFDLLEKRERQILILACVLLLAVLFFYQVFALHQKKVYSHSAESVPAQQKEFEKLNETASEAKKELLRWDEARRDIGEIESKYFYREDEDINQLRIDIRNIIQEARIRVVSDYHFDYANWEEEDLKRVRVTFTMAGPYIALKRLIHQVEIHPKFLMIERIDFRDIDVQSGRIELNIVLAGYYEN
jgi:hypothetical protein